jgi:hypothetical protein
MWRGKAALCKKAVEGRAALTLVLKVIYVQSGDKAADMAFKRTAKSASHEAPEAGADRPNVTVKKSRALKAPRPA